MRLPMDSRTVLVLGGVIALVVLASGLGVVLSRTVRGETARATVRGWNARVRAWWVMCALFVGALFAGAGGSAVLFALVSFLALREYITVAPTRRGDHRALFWAFFVILPLHYYVLHVQWYGLFCVFVPVYAFLFIPIRALVADDHERFVERMATIQWGLMVCVYFVSHAPALLLLELPRYPETAAALLLFLVVTVQVAEAAQFLCDRCIGGPKILPKTSPEATYTGFLAGLAAASAVALALRAATPFSWPEALGVSAAMAAMGFFGHVTMSAVQLARGVRSYQSMMERIAPLCFAAPVFFHYVSYFHSGPGVHPRLF